ncbi:glycoside hydrolase family 16 protein [Ideonella sp. DXS22W]|uniref:Glycoside hydrolase family 16 protein n=1 Tax=Pseudaquabacterium inlustre TaxID=2984192 RepID=A0ABU9CHR7_9BURK
MPHAPRLLARLPLLAGLMALGVVAACGGGSATAADAGTATGSSGGNSGSTASTGPLQLPTGYRLVWADEFDTDGLPDAGKWAYDTGMNKQGWHNRELQYYSGPRAENAVVSGGKLVITARKEARSDQSDWGGQAYSSTRLITLGKKDWTYGFFEVRAKLPCGRGTWPAIWMLNSAGVWPAGGELDIMEQVGSNPTNVFSTVHTTSGSGGNGSGNHITVNDACSAFHNYQMLWTPTEVRFGMDGQTHHVYRNQGAGSAQWPFDKPQFLILNIAIGGDLGGPVDDSIFPVRMEVEHVRVYQAP